MDIIAGSINDTIVNLKTVAHVMSYVWFIAFPPLFYFLFKELWEYYIVGVYLDSLDWALLEIIPPKNIEKSPKPMEALFSGLAGTETTVNTLEFNTQGRLQDRYSLEIVSDGGEMHFYIRTQKKYRHLIEAHLYAQYPDIQVLEVPDYVADIPKVVPNKEWDVWGADLVKTKGKPDEQAFPIRTYMHFKEDVTGKMIDPLAGIAETMSKLPPGQKIWMQIIIHAHSPSWNAKVGTLSIDKLKGKEAKKDEGILTMLWKDLADVFSNVFVAWQKPPEFATEKKKEEQPLEFRLSPGEREDLKAVEDNLGKIMFNTKMRFIVLGRKENFDKSFVSSFMGGIKQFGNESLAGLKPEDASKTYANYVFKKSRLRYRQRKIMRRYRNRSMDGAKITMSTEELATIFHMPDMNVAAPALPRTEAKRGGAPANLPIE